MRARALSFGFGCLAMFVVYGAWSATADRKPSADLLTNRAWVERMPKSKKDLVTWLVPMELKDKRFGVAQRTSHFFFVGERFTWERKGDRMELLFQQSDRKVSVSARASECKDAPPPFELCLDLVHEGKKTRMYSKRSWNIPPPPRDAGATEGLPDFDLTEPTDGPAGVLCPTCSPGIPTVLQTLWTP